MPGMASEGRGSDGGGGGGGSDGGGGGESWFALKKDEFYVILDSVLTDMTKCDERNNVSGCIELIKLLSDDVTTNTAVNDKLSSRDGSRDAKLSDRPNASQSDNNNRSGGHRGHSEDDIKGQLSSCNNKTFVNCRATGIRRSGDDVQAGIRNGVDFRRHNLNKGNDLTSATSLARRGGGPGGIRDKAAATSRLQRSGITFSKEVVGYGRKTRLNGKTRDSLFHPNRFSTNPGTQNIYSNSTYCSDNQNAFNAKQSTSRHQREIAKSHELRHQSKSKPLCSSAGSYYNDAQLNSNRPSTVYRRQHQNSHQQNNPGLSAKTKAHNNFDRNTTERTHIPKSGSSATDDQKSCSETNPRLELRSLTTPFNLSQTVDRRQTILSTTLKIPKSKWTPIDKTVINNILDDILNSCDDSNSPLLLHTDLQTSRNNNDDVSDDCRSADGFLLPSDVKVEDDESDVTSDIDLGNNDVIADVKLVDVRRRYDVSRQNMSFKWKSQLLWRMRHDKVSHQTPLQSSLCLS